jgi:hypothetical protein
MHDGRTGFQALVPSSAVLNASTPRPHGLIDAMVRALIAQDAPLLTDLPEPPRDWTVTTDDDEVLYV